MIDLQPPAHHKGRRQAGPIHEHIRLARKTFQAVDQRLVEIARRIVVPFVHSSVCHPIVLAQKRRRYNAVLQQDRRAGCYASVPYEGPRPEGLSLGYRS
jgi:hypothetical protein